MPPWPRRVCSSYFPRWRGGCCGPVLILAAFLSFSQCLRNIFSNCDCRQLLDVVVCLDHARLHAIGAWVEMADIGVGRLCHEIVQQFACALLLQLVGVELEKLHIVIVYLQQPLFRICYRVKNTLRALMRLWRHVGRFVYLTDVELYVMDVAGWIGVEVRRHRVLLVDGEQRDLANYRINQDRRPRWRV